MTCTLEQNFKKRLQMVARERQSTPAVVWQNIIADRFLARLCQSPYRSNFILKGGTLLAKTINIGRETIDLDFSLTQFQNNVQAISEAIQSIIAIDLRDGFEFRNVRSEILNHFNVIYPGAQVRLDVSFGKNQFSLFIDLAFGDHVEAEESDLLLLSNSKGPLFESSVKIFCFPLEFVFAEKLETILYRGADNSRMKDFHDLWSLLTSSHKLTVEDTLRALKVVCEHRKTPLVLPLRFNEEDTRKLQTYWKRYVVSLSNKEDCPEDIGVIIEAINRWLH